MVKIHPTGQETFITTFDIITELCFQSVLRVSQNVAMDSQNRVELALQSPPKYTNTLLNTHLNVWIENLLSLNVLAVTKVKPSKNLTLSLNM